MIAAIMNMIARSVKAYTRQIVRLLFLVIAVLILSICVVFIVYIILRGITVQQDTISEITFVLSIIQAVTALFLLIMSASQIIRTPQPRLSVQELFRSQLERWVSQLASLIERYKKSLNSILRELTVLFTEVLIFLLYVAVDLLVIWLMGLAFGDVITKFPIINSIYKGITYASLAVIAIRFVANLVIELAKNSKHVVQESSKEMVRNETKEN